MQDQNSVTIAAPLVSHPCQILKPLLFHHNDHFRGVLFLLGFVSFFNAFCIFKATAFVYKQLSHLNIYLRKRNVRFFPLRPFYLFYLTQSILELSCFSCSKSHAYTSFKVSLSEVCSPIASV